MCNINKLPFLLPSEKMEERFLCPEAQSTFNILAAKQVGTGDFSKHSRTDLLSLEFHAVAFKMARLESDEKKRESLQKELKNIWVRTLFERNKIVACELTDFLKKILKDKNEEAFIKSIFDCLVNNKGQQQLLALQKQLTAPLMQIIEKNRAALDPLIEKASKSKNLLNKITAWKEKIELLREKFSSFAHLNGWKVIWIEVLSSLHKIQQMLAASKINGKKIDEAKKNFEAIIQQTSRFLLHFSHNILPDQPACVEEIYEDYKTNLADLKILARTLPSFAEATKEIENICLHLKLLRITFLFLPVRSDLISSFGGLYYNFKVNPEAFALLKKIAPQWEIVQENSRNTVTNELLPLLDSNLFSKESRKELKNKINKIFVLSAPIKDELNGVVGGLKAKYKYLEKRKKTIHYGKKTSTEELKEKEIVIRKHCSEVENHIRSLFDTKTKNKNIEKEREIFLNKYIYASTTLIQSLQHSYTALFNIEAEVNRIEEYKEEFKKEIDKNLSFDTALFPPSTHISRLHLILLTIQKEMSCYNNPSPDVKAGVNVLKQLIINSVTKLELYVDLEKKKKFVLSTDRKAFCTEIGKSFKDNWEKLQWDECREFEKTKNLLAELWINAKRCYFFDVLCSPLEREGGEGKNFEKEKEYEMKSMEASLKIFLGELFTLSKGGKSEWFDLIDRGRGYDVCKMASEWFNDEEWVQKFVGVIFSEDVGLEVAKTTYGILHNINYFQKYFEKYFSTLELTKEEKVAVIPAKKKQIKLPLPQNINSVEESVSVESRPWHLKLEGLKQQCIDIEIYLTKNERMVKSDQRRLHSYLHELRWHLTTLAEHSSFSSESDGTDDLRLLTLFFTVTVASEQALKLVISLHKEEEDKQGCSLLYSHDLGTLFKSLREIEKIKLPDELDEQFEKHIEKYANFVAVQYRYLSNLKFLEKLNLKEEIDKGVKFLKLILQLASVKKVEVNRGAEELALEFFIGSSVGCGPSVNEELKEGINRTLLKAEKIQKEGLENFLFLEGEDIGCKRMNVYQFHLKSIFNSLETIFRLAEDRDKLRWCSGFANTFLLRGAAALESSFLALLAHLPIKDKNDRDGHLLFSRISSSSSSEQSATSSLFCHSHRLSRFLDEIVLWFEEDKSERSEEEKEWLDATISTLKTPEVKNLICAFEEFIKKGYRYQAQELENFPALKVFQTLSDLRRKIELGELSERKKEEYSAYFKTNKEGLVAAVEKKIAEEIEQHLFKPLISVCKVCSSVLDLLN